MYAMSFRKLGTCQILLFLFATAAFAQQSGERLIWGVGLPHGRIVGAPGGRTLVQAWVSDRNFQAVPNAAVTFLAPDSGDFGSFQGPDGVPTVILSATTDMQGVASAWFTGGSEVGPYIVNAVLNGTSEVTNFSFTNQQVLAPTRVTISPAATVSETPCSTSMRP